jgi:sterol desaturase/sphingolipid hydroxylase (fatty acid hydroxylase superfamily)
MITSRSKSYLQIVLAVAFLGALTWLLSPGQPLDFLGAKIARKLDLIVYQPLAQLFKETIWTPLFFIIVGATLVIERVLPAQPQKKFWTPSRLQDFVWFFYEAVLHATIVVFFTWGIYRFYDSYLSFLTIKAMLDLPDWARITIAILLQDFCHYGQHWVHHKVPWLWNLHAVHHSQKELNFFTDFRYHVLEYVLREVFLVVPFLIFAVDPKAFVFYSVARRWYTHFYHANIRTNLGPLRYILVTPQSHRVHHSFASRHWDKNFGSVFVFWDFLFNTQYKGWEEYPETGIPDETFPHEKETDLISLLTMPVKQMFYSFEATGRQIAGMFSPKAAALPVPEKSEDDPQLSNPPA